jgi:hypothetical protein
MRNGGLRQVAQRGGLGEVLQLGDRPEGLEMGLVHSQNLSQQSNRFIGLISCGAR